MDTINSKENKCINRIVDIFGNFTFYFIFVNGLNQFGQFFRAFASYLQFFLDGFDAFLPVRYGVL